VSRFLHKFLPTKRATSLARSLVIALNNEGAAWIEHSPLGVASWRTLEWQGASSGQALETLSLQVERAQLYGCKLVFCPSTMRHWLQLPPLQVASLDELREVASVRCKQLFESASNDARGITEWSVSANWHDSKPFVCTAVQKTWADAINAYPNAFTTSHDLIFLALKQYAAVMPRSGWLALVVAYNLYVIQIKDKHILSLRSLRLHPQADMNRILDLAKEEWTREMLRVDNSTPTLHCLYLRPMALSYLVPTDLVLVPTQTVKNDAATRSTPTPLQLTPDGSALTELMQEAQLVAWCAQHFDAGDQL
jgi:hypothetical protein